MKAEILSHLGTEHPWSDRIEWYEVADSTNTLAKKCAANGAPHGTVILADRQTLGRGRMGRTFLSPGGAGIYMSVILRPNCPPDKLMHLTCAAAVAACSAIESATGLHPAIKWTNDLVLNSKKLSGILTELSVKGGIVDYAIIGIGINCLQRHADFDPTIQAFAGSLTMFTDNPVSRACVAAALIHALYVMNGQLLNDKAGIMCRYREKCITVGKQISLLRADSISHGFAESIDDDGGLIVRFDDGSTKTVTSGEVSIRGMYGYI